MEGSRTMNDEALAQALAREDQERADAELARRLSRSRSRSQSQNPMDYGGPAMVYPGSRNRQQQYYQQQAMSSNSSSQPAVEGRMNCPRRCGLRPFDVSPAQRVHCDACHKSLSTGELVYSCVSCNFDVCESCYRNRGASQSSASSSAAAAGAAALLGQQPTSRVVNGRWQSSQPMSQPQPLSSPFGSIMARQPPPTHMCMVPCIVGDHVCVEMVVDSGAQTSVISLPLAKQLQLESRLDRREVGIAAGVGRAHIVGRIRNVICSLGNVEFEMDFMVLDVPDRMLLLGLDQMRKYKCIIDLEKEILIFGGHGGVEVHMLPATEQMTRTVRNALGNQLGCPMM